MSEYSSLPATMSAIVSRAGGSLAQLEALVDAEVPTPDSPQGHDILVAIKAISVNPIDTKVRSRGEEKTEDRILGWDAAGVVVDVGDEATLFAPGDTVYYAGSIDRPGTNAEYQLVDERIVGTKPKTLDFAQAASLPLTSITAWEALFDKLEVKEGGTGTILILGAAGGVGSILIQLVKSLTNLRIIATASRPQSQAWVKKLGADVVLDHHAPDFEQQILAAAPDGVDYVFSTHSEGNLALFAAVMRPFGKIVALDQGEDLDLMLLKPKALSWNWESMFTRPVYGWDLIEQHNILDRVAELVGEGRIIPTVSETVQGINEKTLREAHAQVENGHMIGKIVLQR